MEHHSSGDDIHDEIVDWLAATAWEAMYGTDFVDWRQGWICI